MVDPVSISLWAISLLLSSITSMAATSHANKDECNRLRTVVETAQAIVKPLSKRRYKLDREMRLALGGLEAALKRSLNFLETCQKMNAPLRCLKAKAIAKKLLQVEKDILSNVAMVNLAKKDIDLRQQPGKSVKARHRSTAIRCVCLYIKYHSLILKKKGLSIADYFFNRTDQPLMITLSISSRDAEIRDLETGKVIATLRSEQRTVLVAGHPTLPILVTALDDGTVCFWDASTYRLQEKVKRVTDEPALDLTFVTDVNDITRLAVTSESTVAIMEVSYSLMPSTSGPTGGGDDG